MLTTLAAVGFLYQTEPARRRRRATAAAAGGQGVGRPAGAVAHGRARRRARGLTARSDRVPGTGGLALEYRDLPEVIHLEEVRRDYGRLLDHYGSLARAVTAHEDRAAARPAGQDGAGGRLLGAPWTATRPAGRATRPPPSCARSAQRSWPGSTRRRPSPAGPTSRGRGWPWRSRFGARGISLWPTGPTRPPSRPSRPTRKSSGTGPSLRQSGQQAEARRRLRRNRRWGLAAALGWVRSQAKWQMEGHNSAACGFVGRAKPQAAPRALRCARGAMGPDSPRTKGRP